MFAYIKGILVEKSDAYVVVETGGIGYQIFMSQTAINNLPQMGENIKIYTHYHVREDNISLYGFVSNEELRMFELLLQVSGIGAKSAIAMLSQITPSSFALAVISNDISKLTKIPGIGKKSAERIILELKDKLKNEQIVTKAEEVQLVIDKNEKDDEVIEALQVLGYNKKEIEKVLEGLDRENLGIEDTIKQVLKLL